MLSGEAERLSGGRHIPAAPLASFSVSRDARPKAASGLTWEQISVTAPAGSYGRELHLFSREKGSLFDSLLVSYRYGVVRPEERAKLAELAVGCPNRRGNMAPRFQGGVRSC